jgi:hypothetical protein
LRADQLADQELAHWNKINAAAFPTTSEVEAQGRSLVAPTFRKVAQHARMVQAQKDKLVMERLLKSVQEKDEAELQQVLKSEKQGLNKVKDFAVQKDTEKSKSTATANKAGAKKSVDTKAQGTEFKVEKGQKVLDLAPACAHSLHHTMPNTKSPTAVSPGSSRHCLRMPTRECLLGPSCVPSRGHAYRSA